MKIKEHELADHIAREVNSMGFDYQEFTVKMKCEHRTLQQNFTRLCLHWIHDLAMKENFDLRNQASVEVAKKIESHLDDYYWNLPTI